MTSSQMTRRRFLSRSLCALSAPAMLGACSGTSGLTHSGVTKGKAAMLLPLSGRGAGVGQRLQQATQLSGRGLQVYDTGSTPETAATAAAQAVNDGATILAGPLFAESTRAVLGTVPREVPVLSLSNDATLAADGAFVMGITPFQSTKTIFDFSAARGVQSVVMVAPNDPLGARFAEATQLASSGLDLRIGTTLVGNSGTDLASDLRAALDGRLPDAVFLPSAGPSLAGLATSADQTGSHLVGSTQWNGTANLTLPALEGAHFSSPDPTDLVPFTLKFKDRFGAAPGLLAALTHDAAVLADTLTKTENPRRALLDAKGHSGALGPYLFAADGRAARDLAVLQILGGSGFLVS